VCEEGKGWDRVREVRGKGVKKRDEDEYVYLGNMV
jgi:hypothetical protein